MAFFKNAIILIVILTGFEDTIDSNHLNRRRVQRLASTYNINPGSRCVMDPGVRVCYNQTNNSLYRSLQACRRQLEMTSFSPSTLRTPSQTTSSSPINLIDRRLAVNHIVEKKTRSECAAKTGDATSRCDQESTTWCPWTFKRCQLLVFLVSAKRCTCPWRHRTCITTSEIFIRHRLLYI